MNLKVNPFYLDDEAIAWVENTLAGMTIEEKAGQLFCVLFKGAAIEEIDEIYSILTPGACMFRPMPLERAINCSNQLRERAEIPLLVAANLEKGGNGIIAEGTLLGSPMEVGATADVTMAEKLGVVCADEAKTVGANWAFAPIIDIDDNFRNPITNTRTFGSNREVVRDMGVAYTKSIQQRGVAAAIKHFPGDGQDERDQHLVTTINTMSCEEWDATYGEIYSASIEAGVLTCMAGHIMQPAYSRRINPDIQDRDIMPATLATELLQGLLRERLGFNGMIVTDASTMAGMTIPMSRSKAVPASIAAGADMFLFSRNLEEDYKYMLEGIESGIISASRLDEAITRILAVKAALKLHKGLEPLDLESAKKIAGCEKHKKWAVECADKAITLVKEQSGVLPISTEKYKRILFYPIEPGGSIRGTYGVREGACEEVKTLLESQGFEVDVFVPQQTHEGKVISTTEIIQSYDLIIYVANLATKSNQTVVRIEWAQPMGANCPHYINDIPTIFISLENPYHLLDVPRIKTFINCYSSHNEVLNMLVEKLMGRSSFIGKSPIDPFCGKWDAHL